MESSLNALILEVSGRCGPRQKSMKCGPRVYSLKISPARSPISSHFIHASAYFWQKPGHTDAEGVVVFDKLLAAQGMHDGRLQLSREFDQLPVSSRAAGSRQNGRFVRTVQNSCQLREFVIGRANRRLRCVNMQTRPLLDGIS